MIDASKYPEARVSLPIDSKKRLKVINKIDLFPALKKIESGNQDEVFISLKTGDGLEELNRRLQVDVKQLCQSLGESPVLTRDRHRFHLKVRKVFFLN